MYRCSIGTTVPAECTVAMVPGIHDSTARPHEHDEKPTRSVCAPEGKHARKGRRRRARVPRVAARVERVPVLGAGGGVRCAACAHTTARSRNTPLKYTRYVWEAHGEASTGFPTVRRPTVGICPPELPQWSSSCGSTCPAIPTAAGWPLRAPARDAR